MPDVVLANADRANLLALVLERLLRRASPPFPEGTFLLRAGKMCARLELARERAVVSSGEGPADCEIEGSLATLASLAQGASPAAAWWRGRLRWRGSVLRALRLAKLLRRP